MIEFEFQSMTVGVIRKQRVTVVILIDRDTVTVGETKRNPKDADNPNMGLRIAFKRALVQNRRYSGRRWWDSELNPRGEAAWRAFRRQFPIATDTRS